ncbi:MAG: protein kinase, partial [Gemmatimonadales bacterium]|nr:protein kinase [Gemmatimonadales bacterium]
GGMATVYLAHDVKHDRKVAIKVLRPELAAVIGAERFLREIKTIATLQHPHILGLIDSGEVNGTAYYVMPYVEGESLRDRLQREKQLPINDAVRLATEVAGALDYAHRHGVIHRDIKPENILLHDGRALVADFGIALAASKTAGSRMTETGMSLGTPHYMSPEQAMGEREITARSDVYALGAMTYEMLIGDPPFTGSTAQAIVAKVMTSEPAGLIAQRKSIPAAVEDTVLTALEKLPADRFASASEFAAALSAPTGATLRAANRREAQTAPGWRTLAPWAIAIIAIVAAAWGWLRPEAARPVLRYGFAPPLSQGVIPRSQTPVASPDGSFLVYLGPSDDGTNQLWVKRRDADAATPLIGTAAAQRFAISPDGGWIVFTANGRLSKIPVTGGAPVLLASENVGGPYGVAWSDDGTIIFSDRSAAGLLRVSANGGAVSPLWHSDSLLALSPSALPGGHGTLFVSRAPRLSTTQLMAIRGPGDTAHTLVAGAIAGEFVGPDLLVYSNDEGRLFVVRLDLKRLKTIGTATAIDERLASDLGFAAFSISDAGTLVKLSSAALTGRMFEMAWVDRTGRETLIDSSWTFQLTTTAANHGWALSPDGSRLAIGLGTDAGDDIWVKPLPTGAPYRVTFDPLSDFRPRWSSDGRFITFLGRRRPEGVYRRRADGSGSDSLLIASILDEAVMSPDDRWLVLRQGSVGAMAGGRNITGILVGIDTAPRPVLVTEFDEMAIALSPDGKWMAYQSNETGRTEVFVRPFPDTDAGKKQVSSGGGVAPLWSRDGKELFYLGSAKHMMSARVTPGDMLGVSAPAAMFRVSDALLGAEASFYTPWDVARDGRFIMARLIGSDEARAGVVVVENWTQTLNAIVKQ